MQVWRTGAVSILAANELHFAKPAEEQKEVVDTNPRAVKVTLRLPILPKRREPSHLSAARGRFEIGVEVS